METISVAFVPFLRKKKIKKMVELFGGGFVINWAYPIYFFLFLYQELGLKRIRPTKQYLTLSTHFI